MPDEERLRAPSQGLRDVGAALGLAWDTPWESVAEFYARCCTAARNLKAAAGITWTDYELASASGGVATFGLKGLPPGGPVWHIRAGGALEELAGAIGMYEDQA